MNYVKISKLWFLINCCAISSYLKRYNPKRLSQVSSHVFKVLLDGVGPQLYMERLM